MAEPLNPQPPADPIVVVCSADRAYVRPLAVMLVSVVTHLDSRRRLDVHVIDGQIPPADKRSVERSVDFSHVRLTWHHANRSRLTGVPLWGRLPISVYDKLLVADVLPLSVRRALWLDCDMLALDDISHVWDSDVSGYALLAVQDPRVPLVSSTFGVGRYRELGLQRHAKYFNAGVMLMDLDRWRREQVSARGIEYLKTQPGKVWFLEQEALNAVLADMWAELEPAWNWSMSMARSVPYDPADAGAKIVHFSGNLKPWKYYGRHPYHAQYFEYVDRTVWAGWRPRPSWRTMALRSYDRPALRRMLHSSERLGIRCWKAATRRIATPHDVAMRDD